MKNTFKLFGIAALTVIIGFTMAACDDGGGGGGGGGNSGPISLSADQWKDGELTSKTPQVQYKFSIKWSEVYYLWWNDSGQGDGFKTGNIKVSAKFSDGTDIFPDNISGVNNGWNSPQTITFFSMSPSDANKSKTVIITVEPYEDSFGTYSIAYTTGYTPARPPSTVVLPNNPTPLAENTWKNGTIAGSTAKDWDWYTLSVIKDTTYNFWWDERSTFGSGMFTGDITVTAYYSDGKEAFPETNTAWTSANSLIPDKNGTLYLMVKLNISASGSVNPGTYAIAYSSTSATKPAINLDNTVDAVQLEENTWKYGTIADISDTNWYKVSVTKDTTYQFWWSDSAHNIHTGDIAVTGYKNDQTVVIAQTDEAWTTAKTYTPAEDGTLYISVKPYLSSPGTYGIVYSTSAARPAMKLNEIINNAVPLEESTWKDGEITSDGVQWYSMQVSAGTYRLWGNDSNAGDSTKTGRVYMSGFYSDGSSVFSRTSSSWTSPISSFTTSVDNTVYIKVTPYSSTSAGTYAIVCGSNYTTRPPNVQNPTALTERQWKNGEITASAKAVWYSFEASAETYYLWWDDNGGSNTGTGTKTANVKVSAYAGKDLFTGADTAWTESKEITVTAAGTVYILVEPYTASGSNTTGTFGIVYSSSSNRPIDFQSISPSPTALALNTWKHGYIATTAITDWYSLSVTSGTTYYLWWNEKSSAGVHSADIRVSGYYSDNSTLPFAAETDIAWDTSKSFTPAVSGTLYISVKLKNYNSLGTYGIVCGTSSTRPAMDLSTIGAKAITSGTWENGNLTAQNNVVWYSYTIPQYSNYLFIWWNDSGQGGGGKTGDVIVSACRSDGTAYKGNSDVNIAGIDNGWSTPQRINYNNITDTMVYLKVEPKNAGGTGTFGIVILNTTSGGSPIMP
jgi:hypothetical protein